jgi:hypothetical protein
MEAGKAYEKTKCEYIHTKNTDSYHVAMVFNLFDDADGDDVWSGFYG